MKPRTEAEYRTGPRRMLAAGGMDWQVLRWCCAAIAGLCLVVAVGTRLDAQNGPSDGRSQAPAAARLKVVATVNGEQITRHQLAEECLRRFGSDVLESVVNKHLIWQSCRERNIEISNGDVDEEIKRIAGKFGLAADRWMVMLQQEREISPEQYRREIIWPTLALRQLAAAQITVTDQELNEAMETEYGPRVKARAITVSQRDEAEKIRAQAIADPEKFGELAKEYSEDQSASVRGLIPPIRKHLGNVDLETIAFALQEGEISPIVKVADQYVILKCESQLPATYIPPKFQEDARSRVHDRVQDQKLRTTAARLFAQLQQEAKVVNVWNDPKKAAQMPGVAAVINGQNLAIQQLSEECLVRHGKDVLEAEINRKILLQALRAKQAQVTDADIQAEIARAADSYGYLRKDGSPDIETWLQTVTKEEDSTVELYIRDAVWPSVALKKLVDQRVEVSEQDIQKGFASNFGPRVEALAIVLNNQRQAQKVWEMARNGKTESFFGELAHQYSVDAVSRENFGKIPPVRRHGGRPELEKEAFSLEPGQLSGIIASGENFVILRCTGYTTPVVKEMDAEVRAELIKDLQEKKVRMAMAVEFERLAKVARIENLLAGTFQDGTARTTDRRSVGSTTGSR